jgi:hypothetical protein
MWSSRTCAGPLSQHRCWLPRFWLPPVCFTYCMDLRRTLGRVETHLMICTKHRILIRNRNHNNPLLSTPQVVGDGKDAFSHYCVACHEMDGQKPRVPFADRMASPVPSLASKEYGAIATNNLIGVIDYAIWPSGMPGSKGILNNDKIWSTIAHSRYLSPAGTLGEPEILQSLTP